MTVFVTFVHGVCSDARHWNSSYKKSKKMAEISLSLFTVQHRDFVLLLPKKMSVFINTMDLMSDLKFSKRYAILIPLKLPKKVFFSRKSKICHFILGELEIWVIF